MTLPSKRTRRVTTTKTFLLALLGSIASVRGSRLEEVDPSEPSSLRSIQESTTTTTTPSRSVETFALFHRFTSSSKSVVDVEWKQRGRIVVHHSDREAGQRREEDDDEQSSVHPSRTTISYEEFDMAWHEVGIPEKLEDDKEEDNEVMRSFRSARYQISIRTSDDSERSNDEEPSFVSVPACELFSKSSGANLKERIVLHSSSTSTLSGYEYKTIPAKQGGGHACQLSSSERSRSTFSIVPESLEVEILEPFQIPTPVLPEMLQTQTPVQLDPEGKVVPPPKPKSFIQKYWLYIVPILIVVMIGGGPEEESKGPGAGGSGGKR